MEIILLRDVPSLGRAGEVVRVKDGYARNYLIPKGFAEPATAENIRAVQERKRHMERKLKRELEKARSLAERLSQIKCVLRRPAGSEGKLFGSVTSADIEEALKALGFEIDRKRIEVGEPIKTLGSHTVSIRLHPEVKVELEVWVEKEE
ncbi:MAG: 50S ribosomal protein L9 [Deltaproteobacteria bacterium]|mgnify:CR=1 FL=1|nr:MAG: 50S ribosomal protein L9 [Deltaproteobacteria bacterium]